MRVTFACGHRAELGDNPGTAPICGECQESRVQHVKARAPRFRGVATGPYTEYANLSPATVACAPGGSLTLKPSKD